MPLAPFIAPSLLACDFSRLGEELRAIEQAGAVWAHFDVMDGMFVPNISIGLPVLEACRKSTLLTLDVHLMVQNPERYLEAFAQAGADFLTIHAEATAHAHRAVQLIKSLGKRAGLAINPATPLETLKPLLPELDLILIMSVNPGFGGQTFIPSSLERLRQAAKLRDQFNPQCLLEVDGGVNLKNIHSIGQAGVDVLVAGSAVFSEPSVAYNFAALKAKLEGREVLITPSNAMNESLTLEFGEEQL
ncbi:MAG: ribulose-phosphate 3-epimerase [Deinococcales bacterium]